MDYILNREALAASEVIYDGCQEQPVDLDINLPDYCPDIQRILKCQVYPHVVSRGVTGDRLELEGTYTVKVLYLDSGGKAVRCCDASENFTATINLKQNADNARVTAFTRVEYINCRAASPRRLDIHGSFSLCAKVTAQEVSDIVSNIGGDDVEQQKKVISVNKMVGHGQQQFSVDEILELGQGKPPADNLIRTDAFAMVQDVKVSLNKLLVTGEVYVKILYSSSEDEASPEAMEYAIPFNQMLDCEGASDDCMSDVQIEVVGIDVVIKNDYSGDKIFFDVQIKMFATAAVYMSSENTVVTDAYSKKYEMNLAYKQKSFDNLVSLENDSYLMKTSLNSEEDTITKVLDIWNEMSTVNAAVENGQIQYKGKLNLCVLALNGDNQPFYFERLADFEYSRPYANADENLRCAANALVGGISYRLTGTGVDVKVELKLNASVSRQENMKMITDATADETKPRAQDKTAALSIYYADPGESLWNIARDYCTSVEAIKLENDLAGEFVENRGMLLIPM